MYEFDVYLEDAKRKSAKVRSLDIKRDWIDPRTYNCYPLTTANQIGYGIYFEEDISFIWDGSSEGGISGILGKEHIWIGRGQGTVSFHTNLIFKTKDNTSLLTMPVPNQFKKEASCISTVLSTSFFTGLLPIVWKIHEPNKEILIPAFTNIACVLPISIKQFNNSNLIFHNKTIPFKKIHDTKNYLKKMKEFTDRGEFAKMYKKAINENNESIGKHEVDYLNMNVTYKND